ncbi:hypothetical protein HS7_00520 [Sulfolobales archaeon HS-7]|nr:hypothetical protein HS7_00520 [Sulfolobales archaeon HS-7]
MIQREQSNLASYRITLNEIAPNHYDLNATLISYEVNGQPHNVTSPPILAKESFPLEYFIGQDYYAQFLGTTIVNYEGEQIPAYILNISTPEGGYGRVTMSLQYGEVPVMGNYTIRGNLINFSLQHFDFTPSLKIFSYKLTLNYPPYTKSPPVIEIYSNQSISYNLIPVGTQNISNLTYYLTELRISSNGMAGVFINGQDVAEGIYPILVNFDGLNYTFIPKGGYVEYINTSVPFMIQPITAGYYFSFPVGGNITILLYSSHQVISLLQKQTSNLTYVYITTVMAVVLVVFVISWRLLRK